MQPTVLQVHKNWTASGFTNDSLFVMIILLTRSKQPIINPKNLQIFEISGFDKKDRLFLEHNSFYEINSNNHPLPSVYTSLVNSVAKYIKKS